ncbi:hypothetical protein WN867_09500 [Tetragenococcus halophilus]|uniref:Uncharacterized protein n=1 Tax=Tetragenococcus halophilus TaxID=51669 RepID=A0AB35HR20_TETHA|nr:hypothetical protein [Tetragenococcus halophilus]MCO8298656.1 hypothetical protein [Tetragenococcus halophilus]
MIDKQEQKMQLIKECKEIFGKLDLEQVEDVAFEIEEGADGNHSITLEVSTKK